MKKLSLNPDALQVESFDIAADGAALRGTVRANSGFTTRTTFTETTTTDPISGEPCVYTLETACGATCIC